MNKLVIIGYVWPEPNSSAAGSRMLQIIDLFLQGQWEVIFASAAALSEHRFNLSQLNIAEKEILLNDSSFDAWLKSVNPAAVLFDRFFTEEQFGWRVEKSCPNALRLLDTEDLHSLRSARQRILKCAQYNIANDKLRNQVGPVVADEHELFQELVADDVAQREIAAIFRCDLSIMISQFEMEFLQSYFSVPRYLLCYIPFLSAQPIANTPCSFVERQHFIAIGNFRHEPNWDAVLYLKHAIWPLIRARLPAAELHVYGSYPPPKAMQLHQPKDGFCVKGWVEDAIAVMGSARVCLAPLRFGAGIKGKLMDAMRCGTPSVTTDIGAEAMSGGLAWCGAIKNSAEDIAAAAVDLYSNEEEWFVAQSRGFEILAQFFSQKNYAEELMDRVNFLCKNLAEERSKNFIGAMLRHHHHKSTQYMSQWIEAKNK